MEPFPLSFCITLSLPLLKDMQNFKSLLVQVKIKYRMMPDLQCGKNNLSKSKYMFGLGTLAKLDSFWRALGKQGPLRTNAEIRDAREKLSDIYMNDKRYVRFERSQMLVG